MSILIGLALIGVYVYLVKYRQGGKGGGKGGGGGSLPWWLHITILGGASCTLANSLVGPGVAALLNVVLGFVAGLLGGLLELIANQPIAFATSVFAGVVGAILLIILVVDVKDKTANKPALAAAIVLPFLFMITTGGFGEQGQQLTTGVAQFSENAGRSIVDG